MQAQIRHAPEQSKAKPLRRRDQIAGG